ncbi:hypothetical protein [Microcoleus sp. herbarium12]|uniref:hypothetical protein n=1 Tax=Microcoleus sp. herbarium12 TaxID=3055437 RepID=UPI002FCE902F
MRQPQIFSLSCHNIRPAEAPYNHYLWKNLWKICPDDVENFTRSPKTIFAAKCTGDRSHQLFHKFSTGIYQLHLKRSKQLFYFSTVSTGRSHKNNSIN